jgi:hypothetical protein
VVMASGLASAASIIATCTTVTGPTELGSATPDTITCNGDAGLPGGAVITGIEITVTGSVVPTSTLKLTNNNLTTQTGSAETIVAYSVPAGILGTTLTSPLFTVFASTPSETLTSGQSVTVNVTGTANSGLLSVANIGTNWAKYEAGTESFSANTTTSFSASFPGGQVTVAQVTTAQVTGTVEFDYTIPSSTPEPATMALMGGALLGLGLIGKRLKKQ